MMMEKFITRVKYDSVEISFGATDSSYSSVDVDVGDLRGLSARRDKGGWRIQIIYRRQKCLRLGMFYSRCRKTKTTSTGHV